MASTTPILPPVFKSVAERLSAGLWQQGSSSHSKKETESEKKRKRKRESILGDDVFAPSNQGLSTLSTLSSNGDHSEDIAPTMFERSKDSERKRKRSLGAGEEREVETPTKEMKRKRKPIENALDSPMSALVSSQTDEGALRDDEGDDEGEDRAARKRRKREAKAARKALKKARLELVSSQTSSTNIHALPDHVEAKALARLVSGGVGASTTPDARTRTALLLQTIMKGRKSDGVAETGSRPSNEVMAVQASRAEVATSSHAVPVKAKGAEVVTVKPKKPRKSKAKAKKADHNANEPDESLSQTIQSMKTSSTSKIQALFAKPATSPSPFSDFFDDEPLSKKRERMRASATATSTPWKAAAHPRPRAKAALEGWESKSGRVRGIIRVHNDEEPEENFAFSSSYLSERPKGVSIHGANFRVKALPPGQEYAFEKESAAVGLRICSVATGVVEVTLGPMKFAIGRGGMWRVKKDEACCVRNKGAEETVVHVTSMT